LTAFPSFLWVRLQDGLMLNSPKKLPKPDETGIKNSDVLLAGEGAEGGRGLRNEHPH